jgi:hypothetical protein
LTFWLHFSFQCKSHIYLNKMSLYNYTMINITGSNIN